MTARPTARPRLRSRLIAWYAGTMCCVLLLAAVALRFGVDRTLDRAHVESLESSVALFRQFFRVEIAEYRSVEATLSHIAGELVFEDRVIDVHRPDGSLFSVTGAPVTEDYPSLRAPVRTLRAPLDPLIAPGWTIEVHGSKATLVAALRRLDLWLLGGIPAVVLLAAALGWWLAGRALRPIGALAAQAQQLDAAAGSRLTLPDATDELGRLGTSFNALLDRLDDALAQQRRFLTDAAHELRTPIARLRSRVELGRLSLGQLSLGHADAPYADAPSLRHETDRLLATLDGELRDTSEVLHGLLALAHADAAVQPSRFSVGYLDDVLLDELPRWRETAAAAGVQIALGTYEELPARFDAALMRRLLALLLDNAVRYSPAGSTVTVHLAPQATCARLTVEDQGIGIEPVEREAVFARFHRTERARAHRADGSGLGLALARWIVLRHGGTIRADARADGEAGVAIVVDLPIAVSAIDVSRQAGVARAGLPPAVEL
jgi:two-component system OmpR family sensor kinase